MPTQDTLKERLAEAARYALLRRLAPAIRHNMAGSLQPVSMIAAMLEKRLQKPDPDMAALAKNSASINTLARDAAAECMSLMTWLAPKDNKPVAIGAGIEDAIGLLTTELSFRGFTLVNQTAGIEAEVPASALRSAFMAALVTLTDLGTGPANVVIASSQQGGAAVITLDLAQSDGELMPAGAPSYRQLQWEDVEAIAEAESVSVSHSPNRVELRHGTAA